MSSFSVLPEYFHTHFWWQPGVSCPGLYGGLYGQNLAYKFKKLYGDFYYRNFEKSYWTTGSRGQIWDRIRDTEKIMV